MWEPVSPKKHNLLGGGDPKFSYISNKSWKYIWRAGTPYDGESPTQDRLAWDDVFESPPDELVRVVSNLDIVKYIEEHLTIDHKWVQAVKKELKKFQEHGIESPFSNIKGDITDEEKLRLAHLSHLYNSSWDGSDHSAFVSFDLNRLYYSPPDKFSRHPLSTRGGYTSDIFDEQGVEYKHPDDWKKDKAQKAQKGGLFKQKYLSDEFIEQRIKRIMLLTSIYSSYDQNGINLVGRTNWYNTHRTSVDEKIGPLNLNVHPQLSLIASRDFSVKGVSLHNMTPYGDGRIRKGEIVCEESVDWNTIIHALLTHVIGSTAEVSALGLLSHEDWEKLVHEKLEELKKNPQPAIDNRGGRIFKQQLIGGYADYTLLSRLLIEHHYLCKANGVIPLSAPTLIDPETKGIYYIEFHRPTKKRPHPNKSVQSRRNTCPTKMVSFDSPVEDFQSYRSYSLSAEKLQEYIGKKNIPFNGGLVRIIPPDIQDFDWSFYNETANMVAQAIVLDLSKINREMTKKKKELLKGQGNHKIKRLIEGAKKSGVVAPKKSSPRGGGSVSTVVDKDGNPYMRPERDTDFDKWFRSMYMGLGKSGPSDASEADMGSGWGGIKGVTNAEIRDAVIGEMGAKWWNDYINEYFDKRERGLEASMKKNKERLAKIKELRDEDLVDPDDY